ncbi:MAG: hypothetical protein GXP55_01405 [Deltaproteobacteria bacterium]|nr:hypothetical protein [Deltaproteobacteria bacterium]
MVVSVETNADNGSVDANGGVHLQVKGAAFYCTAGTWVDADGRRTPVPASFQSGRLAFSIPASVIRSTAWPATLDPIVGPEIALGNSANTVDESLGPDVASNGFRFFIAYPIEDRPSRSKRLRFSRITSAGVLVDDVEISSLRNVTSPRIAASGSNVAVVFGLRAGGGGSSSTVIADTATVAPLPEAFVGAGFPWDVNVSGSSFRVVSSDRGRFVTANLSVANVISPSSLLGTSFSGSWIASAPGLAVWSARASASNELTSNGTVSGTFTPTNRFDFGRLAHGADGYLLVGETTLSSGGRGAAGILLSESGRFSSSPMFDIGRGVHPDVAPITGGYLVVWERAGKIFGVRITLDGTIIDPSPKIIAETSNPLVRPAVGSDGGDKAMVAYISEVGNFSTGHLEVVARLIDLAAPGLTANGGACASRWDCGSGECVDGVCCDTACTGGCGVCSASLGASADGVCTVAPVGDVCRGRRGVCDRMEMCDGVTMACPSDAVEPAGTSCGNTARDLCDADDACDGVGPTCPDVKRPSGYVCRDSTAPCDAAETCDGAADACPPDELERPGVVCAAATGVCDQPDVCNGTTSDCPALGVVPAGSPCRPEAGACDVAEVCDGASPECPPDVVSAGGTACRPVVGPCDLEEQCDGASGVCPSDEVVVAGEICRPAVGGCDVADECNGLSTACPQDLGVPDGMDCGDGLVCNGIETCRSRACVSGDPLICDGPGASCDEAQGGCVSPGGGCDVSPSGPSGGGPALVFLILAVVAYRRQGGVGHA